MAKIAFKGYEQYGLRLEALGRHFFQDEPMEKAVRAGADLMCDEIRKEINGLPTEPYRYMMGASVPLSERSHDEYDIRRKFENVPVRHKLALQEGLGITPIEHDSHGFVNAKIGFDGYSKDKTKKYPKGVPVQLLARSIESGSSVREKHPFVRPAVHRKRKEAIQAMEDELKRQIEGIMADGKLVVD